MIKLITPRGLLKINNIVFTPLVCMKKYEGSKPKINAVE
jgi:hypothetical protein